MSSPTRRPRLRGVLALSVITVGVAVGVTACEAPQGPAPELVSVRSHGTRPTAVPTSSATTAPVDVAIDVAVVVERGGDTQVRER